MSHVRTSPYYPQSNGKIERFHQSLKRECIRPKTPISLEDARKTVEKYIKTYNTERFHSSIGYITPLDKLEGRAEKIQAERKIKLSQAVEKRKEKHQKMSLKDKINLAEKVNLADTLSVE